MPPMPPDAPGFIEPPISPGCIAPALAICHVGEPFLPAGAIALPQHSRGIPFVAHPFRVARQTGEQRQLRRLHISHREVAYGDQRIHQFECVHIRRAQRVLVPA